MVSFNVSIIEGVGGYVSSGYTSTGYVVAGTILTDVLAAQMAANRALSQTLTLTDAIGNLDIGRAIAQTITNINVVVRQAAFTRLITQGTGGYTSSGYTASGYLTDNFVQITDAVARVRDVPRALSETATITDAVARLSAFSRAISQTVTTTEVLARVYNSMRTITQTLTTTDAVVRAATFTRTILQTISIAEILSGIKGVPGVGVTRIRETTAIIFKRSGITQIFKRSATTSS